MKLKMIKKIMLIMIGLLMFTSAAFGAVVSSYDYFGCCARVNFNVVEDVKFVDGFDAKIVPVKPQQAYLHCENLGCGCLNCDYSRVGVGFNEIKTYNTGINYVPNYSGQFRNDEYYKCID